jgi:hypothetical protein
MASRRAAANRNGVRSQHPNNEGVDADRLPEGPTLRPPALLPIEQLDTRHLHPGGLCSKGLARLGYFSDLQLDVAQVIVLARPQPAFLGPLLPSLGFALFLRTPRVAPQIGVARFCVGVARLGDRFFSRRLFARGRLFGCGDGLRTRRR